MHLQAPQNSEAKIFFRQYICVLVKADNAYSKIINTLAGPINNY